MPMRSRGRVCLLLRGSGAIWRRCHVVLSLTWDWEWSCRWRKPDNAWRQWGVSALPTLCKVNSDGVGPSRHSSCSLACCTGNDH